MIVPFSFPQFFVVAASKISFRLVGFCALMLALASAGNGVMDALATHYEHSVFAHFSGCQQWLNPRLSWRNKWKNGDPKQGEAFALSSTAAVPITDAWHCAKALTILCVALAVVAPLATLYGLSKRQSLLLLLGIALLHGVVFEGLYGHLLVR